MVAKSAKPTKVVKKDLLKRSADSSPLFDRVREILESARESAARSVNSAQVVANWLIGREIVLEQQKGASRAGYGEQVLAGLSKELTSQFGKGYSVDNLEAFRTFFREYPRLIPETASRISGPGAISETVSRKSPTTVILNSPSPPTLIKIEPGKLQSGLSWSHYRLLLRVTEQKARSFYEVESVKNGWSVRELERQVNSLLFERLAKSRDKVGLLKLAIRGQEVQTAADVFKDPMVVEFTGLPESERLQETELEQALISNLRAFLLELGKGFGFMKRQERLTLDGDHFYVDLVFYHAILKCYILIDLKVGKLTHADLGQMQLYVNYYDRERRSEQDNPTLGLILCTDKNDAVVKYTLGEALKQQIFASRYQLHLPTEAELKSEIRRELKELNQ